LLLRSWRVSDALADSHCGLPRRAAIAHCIGPGPQGRLSHAHLRLPLVLERAAATSSKVLVVPARMASYFVNLCQDRTAESMPSKARLRFISLPPWAGSVASLQTRRCPPSSHKSPVRLTGFLMSSGDRSAESSSRSTSVLFRASISAGSKPVISMLRSYSGSRTANSPSSAARTALSQAAVAATWFRLRLGRAFALHSAQSRR
jgi:hypothetical protein